VRIEAVICLAAYFKEYIMLMTEDQALQYCPEIDRKTLKYAVKKGLLATVRPTPRRILYTKVDLDAWRASWRRVAVTTGGAE
jgi:hypothetical protein